MKRSIIGILDYLRYQVENDKCTEEQMKKIHHFASKELHTQATLDEMAEFYGQSRSNVSNVLSRRPIPRDKKPQRRVFYDLGWFSTIIPDSWKKSGR